MIEKENVVLPDHSLNFDGLCGWQLSSLGAFFGDLDYKEEKR